MPRRADGRDVFRERLVQEDVLRDRARSSMIRSFDITPVAVPSEVEADELAVLLPAGEYALCSRLNRDRSVAPPTWKGALSRAPRFICPLAKLNGRQLVGGPGPDGRCDPGRPSRNALWRFERASVESRRGHDHFGRGERTNSFRPRVAGLIIWKPTTSVRGRSARPWDAATSRRCSR